MTTTASVHAGPFNPTGTASPVEAWLYVPSDTRTRTAVANDPGGPLVLHLTCSLDEPHGAEPGDDVNELVDLGLAVLGVNPPHTRPEHARSATAESDTTLAPGGAALFGWTPADASHLPALVHHARRAVATEAPIGVLGRLGAATVALQLALDAPDLVAACVLDSVISDVLAWSLTRPRLLHRPPSETADLATSSDLAAAALASPAARLGTLAAPLLLLHPDHDPDCDPGQSDLVLNYALRAGLDATMVRYPHAQALTGAHAHPEQARDRHLRIRAFLASNLGLTSTTGPTTPA